MDINNKQSKYGTDFIESEIMLAATNRDLDHVAALVHGLNESERKNLLLACGMIKNVTYTYIQLS